ncbi:MAG: hypothetical protein ACRC0L_12545, partial [Angustibacter sp.]
MVGWLRGELGAPAGAVSGVLVGTGPGGTGTFVPAGPLVDRGELLTDILDLEYQGFDVDFPTPWVHGPPRWGKSTFAAQAVERVRADGGLAQVVRWQAGAENQLIFWRELLETTREFYAKNRKHPSAATWAAIAKNMKKDYGKDWATRPLSDSQISDRDISEMWQYVTDLSSGMFLLLGDLAKTQGFNRFVVVLDDAHLDPYVTSCVE